MYKRLLLLLLPTLLLLNACREEPSHPRIYVSPSDLAITAEVAEVLDFEIMLDSEIKIDKILIEVKPSTGFRSSLLDSTLGVKKSTINFQYRIPSSFSNSSVLFTFTVIDEDGTTGLWSSRVHVADENANPLIETTAHIMYSSSSTKNNAYDLETNSAQLSIFADSSSRDIQDYTSNSDTLSRAWFSPAKGKMLVFNGFDYANATIISLKSAFQAGSQQDLVQNLAVGDIILCKLGSILSGREKYAALKISAITDNPGRNDDSYTFSIKKAP